ncbi:MAG: excinuclease ABC subunit UvrC [Clostridiales bacterium]|jgi:excinuclease ABC subunit C|nr:excinuclease ABC subunit UvrC [Clostridiales bacterium]
MSIEEKLKNLPALPGVYIMLDADGNIIYVGKARYLKNRVRQYFHASANRDDKVSAMVRRVADFRYIVVNNEVEALLLESNLIKRHKPQYNILLKDDKAYPFIKIDLNKKYPKIEITRNVKNDGAKYFGPYMLGISVRDMVNLIEGAFPLRNCSLNFDKISVNHRPCLNYHIKRCLAPCAYDAEAEYKDIISGVMDFLSGQNKDIEQILTKKMNAAKDNEDFETAIYYRDNLKILDKVVRKQIAVLKKDFDLDVFGAAENGMFSVISLIVVRGGKIVGEENFMSSDASFSISEALGSFIRQYYAVRAVNAAEIVVSHELEDKLAMEEILNKDRRGAAVKIACPKQGVRKQLIDTAVKNAEEYMRINELKADKKREMTYGAVELLKGILGLKRLPKRIEAYDISNISGQYKVSSMVVFTDGMPDNAQYRRFKIKTVEGADDFASMNETLMRRLDRLKPESGNKDASFSLKPDLILIDGGKGQLSSAYRALCDCGAADIEIISLAKREEEIYTLHSDQPTILEKTNLALNMLMRLRDEAHRFAITYFRRLKASKEFESILSAIDGIGKAKIESLYKTFRTIGKIKEAPYGELLKCPRIGKKDAENIINFFVDEANKK